MATPGQQSSLTTVPKMLLLEKISLHSITSYFFQHINEHSFFIIGGDTNALIGKYAKNNFCSYNSSNRNSEYLAGFFLGHRLVCINYTFRKKEVKTMGLSKVKLASVVVGNQKAPFSIATTSRCRGQRNSFPMIAPFYS